jgi:putative thioredoxin
MSESIVDVTLESFEAEVLEASFRMPVVVDFWAPWCGPCRALGPVLDKMAVEFAGRIHFVKINSDENPELAGQFGVRGIPNVKVVAQGQLVDEFTGALPESEVRHFLQGLLDGGAAMGSDADAGEAVAPDAQDQPALGLREQAMAALQGGDADGAQALLEAALAQTPEDLALRLDLVELLASAGRFEAASAFLEGIELAPGPLAQRHEAVLARLALAQAAAQSDTRALEARVAAHADDLTARLELAQALAARGDLEPAFEQLLEIVRRDRSFQDDVGRRTMLTLFQSLGDQAEAEDLVRRYRRALATTLN